MSYLVLARKWRPKRFAELVGQEHVVRALTNALDSGRVHHAFLFTGTRGVGKTTIARIFAKSLNCERGTSAEPCGECNSCRDIDAGRFIDLLEIDAASNTGVDNVREVIDNAQYMPSRGRVKVYLIDEVHMLSKQAFNALLKTLEEPPGHVKFLLATTDPQKLPVTVLSRCLQFNLKRLDEAQIGGQLRRILQAEEIAVEDGAIRELARAADGSLRDGLSLLDQAIAYTGSQLTDAGIASMLGTVDRDRVSALLAALCDGDGAALMAEVARLGEFSPDWDDVLEAVAEALHRAQVRQLVADAEASGDVDTGQIHALAAACAPEVVQLWYQMALTGRRDLPFAPSPRAGFEMVMLRMLAFRPSSHSSPVDPDAKQATAEASSPAVRKATFSAAPSAPIRGATPASPAEVAVVVARDNAAVPPARSAAPVNSAIEPTQSTLDTVEAWRDWVAQCELKGPVRLLAESVGFLGCDGRELRLSIEPSDEHLRGAAMVKMLADAVSRVLGVVPQIRFDAPSRPIDSVRVQAGRERDARQSAAEARFAAHPDVQRLVAQGGRIVPDSVRPLEDQA
ncbi:MAG: DNA polymerase III subunit gamma/tau [Lysobacter sp.]|nr:MAG: DNA polymerase III subunit gamma/tau [Lysobacter sp.]